ncbi:MAG: hypothetical protein JW976_09625 [Syntrophaceae bacterium]|nr:hypothetical protein [Syntrophaceae bacterium]
MIDNDLVLGNKETKNTIKNLSVSDLKIPIPDSYIDKFALSTNQESVSTKETGKKSIADNIKINFSLTNNIMNNKTQIYSEGDDEQISKLIKAMTSLIYNDSRTESLEIIGEIIEPQINFYFEF